ncbi:MAG: AvaI/BsoBI family type II restriction endonuclease [Candidatus Zixiibacteriota bacterium]
MGALRELLEDRDKYLACGELKGGIDPAGADEHWKTANSALGRIRQHFSGADRPALFFVGAAIETAMAEEIFAQISDGQLTCAANFTVPQQVLDLASFLVTL